MNNNERKGSTELTINVSIVIDDPEEARVCVQVNDHGPIEFELANHETQERNEVISVNGQ